jgi:endogenous inhibitor of DNA gyrase (YacG/DUF329 family)
VAISYVWKNCDFCRREYPFTPGQVAKHERPTCHTCTAIIAAARNRGKPAGRACQYCGKRFKPHNNGGRQRWCSRACGMMGRRGVNLRERECAHCKGLFRSRMHRQMYCCKACSNHKYQGRPGGRYAGRKAKCQEGATWLPIPDPSLAPSNRACVICGDPVRGNAKRVYCSEACQQIAYRRRHGQVVHRTTCITCDGPLPKYHSAGRMYCSHRCLMRRHYRLMKEKAAEAAGA